MQFRHGHFPLSGLTNKGFFVSVTGVSIPARGAVKLQGQTEGQCSNQADLPRPRVTRSTVLTCLNDLTYRHAASLHPEGQCFADQT
jgi:hypothetical protein